jgi:hypothetical protein
MVAVWIGTPPACSCCARPVERACQDGRYSRRGVVVASTHALKGYGCRLPPYRGEGAAKPPCQPEP